MSRSDRIQRIANLSRNFERTAAQSLASTRLEIKETQKQLNDLLLYREEYRINLRCGTDTTMNGAEVRKLRAFIAQVDAVINALTTKTQAANRRYDQARENWQKLQQRSKAIDGIAHRELRLESNAAEARTQREIDDRFSSRPSD
ncbi:MAG: flagellar FliJ protein [Gammaproteobacteria bacterium]|jgi:flagellar FliJ protein